MNSIFYYIVAMSLHEWGHYIVASRLGYRTDGILFAVYGAGLKSNNCYKPKDDIMISMAGPVISLMTAIVLVVAWWMYPTVYVFTHEFVICNIVIFAFNILPIYPLDGGRVLFAVMSMKSVVYSRRVYRVNYISCVLLGLLFLILFIVSIFYKTNINLLFIGMFMTLNPLVYDKNNYYNKICAYNKNTNVPKEIKTFRVGNLDTSQLYKYLSPHYISRFEICDGNKVKIIEEKDLLN